MTKIKDITNWIWVKCPKCGKDQPLEEWGKVKCLYIGEGKGADICGNEYDVPYNPDLLLSAAVKLKKDYDELLKTKISLPAKEYRLQKVLDGWILVPQN